MGNSDAVGRMPAPHGVGTSGSSDCGDTVRIEVALREGCVETIRFQAYGCPAAIGAAAEVARGAEGVALLDILSRGATDVAEVLELPPAVSYTHLRAHETVLDLVCRLLLEKKKKKKQT